MYQIKNRDKLISYIIENIQHGIPLRLEHETTMSFEPHHALVPDSKFNRRVYPLLIDNPLNVYLFSHIKHELEPKWGIIRNSTTLDLIEGYLKDFEDTILNEMPEDILSLIRDYSNRLIQDIEKHSPEILKNNYIIQRIPHAFNYIAYIRR